MLACTFNSPPQLQAEDLFQICGSDIHIQSECIKKCLRKDTSPIFFPFLNNGILEILVYTALNAFQET